jgi:hypothetical protein
MISIQLSGRLGNQMFQYAVCKQLLKKMDMIFIYQRDENSHGQNISNYFDIDMGLMRI